MWELFAHHMMRPDLEQLENQFGSLISWCKERVEKARSDASGPQLIGLNAPQGAGKTTLAAFLVAKLEAAGYSSLSISIDDFYLTRAEQSALAEKHADNPYLQARGYPGTHDLELGTKVLTELSQMSETIRIPRYDKSANGGLGDRLPESRWSLVEERPDVVFLEGWMLGFQSLPQQALSGAMGEINALLSDYHQWDSLLSAFIILRPKSSAFVVDWRVEAEATMVDRLGEGMTPAQARAYIELFLPAYEVYGKSVADGLRIPKWRAVIGKDRSPLPDSVDIDVA